MRIAERGVPHGLHRIGEDDFLVRVPLLLVVSAMVDELHLFEHGGLYK